VQELGRYFEYCSARHIVHVPDGSSLDMDNDDEDDSSDEAE
jgi:hypothetical protein